MFLVTRTRARMPACTPELSCHPPSRTHPQHRRQLQRRRQRPTSTGSARPETQLQPSQCLASLKRPGVPSSASRQCPISCLSAQNTSITNRQARTFQQRSVRFCTQVRGVQDVDGGRWESGGGGTPRPSRPSSITAARDVTRARRSVINNVKAKSTLGRCQHVAFAPAGRAAARRKSAEEDA